MKTLYFEGAGWSGTEREYGLNCRIRTAFTNDLGHRVYLEIMVGKRQKFMKGDPRYAQIPPLYVVVDSCHYITEDKNVRSCQGCRLMNGKGEYLDSGITKTMPYTPKSVLEIVNKGCHCSFDNIEVLPDFAGYRVFKDTNRSGTAAGYNYGDEFQYDSKLTAKITAKVEELKEKYSKLFHQRYDNTSYWREGNDLHVRINVSDKVMKEAGIEERNYVIGF